MGIFSNKISREEVKVGDHIYSWRAYVYAHHGIYVGDGKVIQFTPGRGKKNETRPFWGKIIGSSSPSFNYPRCEICRDRSSLGCVITSCLDCFLAGGDLRLYKYNVSRASFFAKPRGGTRTLATSDSPEDVLYRANFLLSGKEFGVYDLIDNNCESFAIYCKTGLMVNKEAGLGTSGQVDSATAAGFATLLLGFGASPVVGYGVYCYGRLVSDIGASGRDDVINVPVDCVAVVLSSARKSPTKSEMSVSYLFLLLLYSKILFFSQAVFPVSL